MKRSQVQIALYMLAVFLSGAVVGGFAHRLYMVKTVTAEPRRPEDFRRKYVNDMRERLKLDDTQAARLNDILDRTAARFKQFREDHKQETDAIHEEQVREIRAMLNASQQADYEQFRLEREKRRRDAEGKR